VAHYRLRSVWLFGALQQISMGFASCRHYCNDVTLRKPTKICTMFGYLLGWYTIFIFGGSCSITEFCNVQNSLFAQVLCSPVLTALLHGTRGASAKLCGVEQRAPPIFGRAAITLGISPHYSSCYLLSFFPCLISAVADWMSTILPLMVWP